MWTILSINWTAQALTDEQLLVLRNVAARFLREGRKAASIRFSHPLCEGLLTRKREGAFGSFGGTFFHADLGLVKGKRWTCDFLLPSGTEDITPDDDSIVISSRQLASGEIASAPVDLAKTAVADASTHTIH